uniref:Putative secreted peptide n=1 Tax=Anopheles braziliensis TaxID=58242 RepID=A0A2M3ZPL1_9DIPT
MVVLLLLLLLLMMVLVPTPVSVSWQRPAVSRVRVAGSNQRDACPVRKLPQQLLLPLKQPAGTAADRSNRAVHNGNPCARYCYSFVASVRLCSPSAPWLPRASQDRRCAGRAVDPARRC